MLTSALEELREHLTRECETRVIIGNDDYEFLAKPEVRIKPVGDIAMSFQLEDVQPLEFECEIEIVGNDGDTIAVLNMFERLITSLANFRKERGYRITDGLAEYTDDVFRITLDYILKLIITKE